MDKLKLDAALEELLHRTETGDVEWKAVAEDKVRAKLGELWVVIASTGQVKLLRSETMPEPPYRAHDSEFVFGSEVAERVYVEAVSQNAPRSSEMFIDKMLGDE